MHYLGIILIVRASCHIPFLCFGTALHFQKAYPASGQIHRGTSHPAPWHGLVGYNGKFQLQLGHFGDKHPHKRAILLQTVQRLGLCKHRLASWRPVSAAAVQACSGAACSWRLLYADPAVCVFRGGKRRGVTNDAHGHTALVGLCVCV